MNTIVWLLVAVTAAPGAADAALTVATENAGVHQPAIDALRDRYEGIFDGTGCADGDGLCPSEPLERWEMAVWLVRVLDGKEPAHAGAAAFDDVDEGIWWAAHTGRLAELAVTRGCDSDPPRYCPSDHVTRGQMATFLVRAFDLPAGPAAGFVDVSATNAHAADIDALAEAGVTAGCDIRPARYCPRKAVTRAQMATFLARATGIIDTPQPQPPTYTAISAGGFHTCALDSSGAIKCWGSNEDGQATPPAGTYTTISAGGFHTCALTANGQIDCWGYDEDGQATPPAGTYTTISAGGFHTCALTANGQIDCWGYDGDGQATPPAGTYTTISAGRQHTCALDTGGNIRCWGDNTTGQTEAPAGSHTAIAAGGFHTCALDTGGSVECWGNNDRDQATPPTGRYTTITAGWQHTCALDTNGTIECWGDDTIRQTNSPTGTHTSIAAGAFHTCALTTASTATCWGNNENGQTNTPSR